MKFAKVTKCDVLDSPTSEKCIGTGRAKCRICGEKIEKGEECFSFFFSLTDGGSYNAWTSIEGKAHQSCFPEFKPEY